MSYPAMILLWWKLGDPLVACYVGKLLISKPVNQSIFFWAHKISIYHLFYFPFCEVHGSYSCFTSSVTKAKPWWCCDFSQYGTSIIGKHCCCGSRCSRKVRKSKACLMKSVWNGTRLLKWDFQEALLFRPLLYLYKWCFHNYKILEWYLNILIGSESTLL